MSNLPRFGRTWNRFSSLPRPGTATRPETQPFMVTTEPEVYPSAVATTNTLQTSPIKQRTPRLSSPVKKFSSPPSSPKYSGAGTGTISPRKPLSPPSTYNRYDGERRTSATTSPKTFKPTGRMSPPPSPPKPRHSTTVATAVAPLSPLALPRSEVRREPEHSIRPRSPPEIEQKKILYQTTTTTEKPTKTDYRQTDQYGSSKPQQKQHHQQLQSDVINIKGENVGAVMHITQSSDGSEVIKKKPSVGQSKENEEKANKSNSNFPGKSFMNSNFQGVNNSILYNSSLSHRDPGLHLAFSSKNPKHGDSIHDSRH